MTNQTPAGAWPSVLFRFTGVMLLAAWIPQCTAAQPSDESEAHLGSVQNALEHCGGVACTSNGDCTITPPVCTMASSATCLTTTPRECAWKLNISASCPCIEHTVRLCNFSGSPGVQICTASSSTSTYWAACVACPSCSP